MINGIKSENFTDRSLFIAGEKEGGRGGGFLLCHLRFYSILMVPLLSVNFLQSPFITM